MNNYGCSLIWGHPQGPTGLRSVIELIEELVQRGGGRGLFVGCAAGDAEQPTRGGATAHLVFVERGTRRLHRRMGVCIGNGKNLYIGTALVAGR